jgi:hypothetical protein
MAVSLAAQDAPVISDALLADVLEIETLVSGTRGITPLIPVDRRFPSSEEVQTFLRNSIDEQLTPEYERQAESFYVAFGFIEPTLDLKETFLALLQDQVASWPRDGVVGDVSCLPCKCPRSASASRFRSWAQLWIRLCSRFCAVVSTSAEPRSPALKPTSPSALSKLPKTCTLMKLEMK